MKIRRVSLSSASIVVLATTLSTYCLAQTPTSGFARVTVTHVKPDMVNEWLDLQKNEVVPALKKAGVEHELVLVENAPHSFHLQPKQRDLRPLVLGFFDKHLKTK